MIETKLIEIYFATKCRFAIFDIPVLIFTVEPVIATRTIAIGAWKVAIIPVTHFLDEKSPSLIKLAN